jgi:hypothetical protein
MVLAFKENQAIGVVHPIRGRGKMKLWSKWFFILPSRGHLLRKTQEESKCCQAEDNELCAK